MTVRLTRRRLQDVAREVAYRHSNTDFVTDLLDVLGYPEGFTVLEVDPPPSADVTTVVALDRIHALVCIDVLRSRGTVFADAGNTNAALACRTLAEQLYEASQDLPPKKPKKKTRYDMIGGDDE